MDGSRISGGRGHLGQGWHVGSEGRLGLGVGCNAGFERCDLFKESQIASRGPANTCWGWELTFQGERQFQGTPGLDVGVGRWLDPSGERACSLAPWIWGWHIGQRYLNGNEKKDSWLVRAKNSRPLNVEGLLRKQFWKGQAEIRLSSNTLTHATYSFRFLTWILADHQPIIVQPKTALLKAPVQLLFEKKDFSQIDMLFALKLD